MSGQDILGQDEIDALMRGVQQGAVAETGPEAAPFQPPAVAEVAGLFPQLEILAFIGKVCLGAVYQARQPALDRFVALASLIISHLFTAWTVEGQGQDIESMPPVVVKTVPESGAKNVAPGVVEIKVTFSKEMTDGSWSWSTAWQGSTPDPVGKPKYEPDRKTCVMKVKLEPNKTYAYWLNNGKFQNFKDRQGHPSVPYLLVFQTKDK